MKRIVFTLVCSVSFFLSSTAQTNILVTNSLAEQILLGNYDPAGYLASSVLTDPDTISKGINTRVPAIPFTATWKC